ncbi:MAG: substrate-binding domain-containing protein [Lachnospiraceae bacterium]|nr:substrate-binding domain-containing protein [Lachnospiraceae bacterium]
MKFKKVLALTLCAAVMGSMALTGCGSSSSSTDTTEEAAETTEASTEEEAEETGEAAEETSSDFDTSSAISVLSREDGSGTRGAFIELFGIEVKNEDGEKEDMTTVDAVITNNTEVMMSTVAGDTYAIGYVSLGSLNDSVKAVQIDGVDATTDNVADGSYAIARPFNIVTQDNLSDVAQDFIDYIMSADGQAVISENGYIEAAEGEAFETSGASGTISIGGSSSVSPVMEKLKETYEAINPEATIEIQTTDSTTGITNAIEGSCDIGMASRDLKEEETGVTATCIAMDGIAVIVNNDNPLTNLTSDMVYQIFTGEVTTWSDVE